MSIATSFTIHGEGKSLRPVSSFPSDLYNGDGSRSLSLILLHALTPTAARHTGDAMLELKAAGKAKSVGVSNFGIEQLQGLKAA